MMPVIFDVDNILYRQEEISFASLTHLTTLGLITFDKFAPYCLDPGRAKIRASYFGQAHSLKTSSSQELPIGHATFTAAGGELNRVLKGKPNDTWRDLSLQGWDAYGWKEQTSTTS
jgi:hypothetical protein